MNQSLPDNADLSAPPDTINTHIHDWKCRTFFQTVLYGLVPVTAVPLGCFIWFGQWSYAAALLLLLGVFAASCLLARRGNLDLAVYITLAAATAVSFSYLLQTGRADTLFFMVFVIIPTGIFLGPAAAFFWSGLHAFVLVALGVFSSRFTVFPDMTTYFGNVTESREPGVYFSTFILLYMVSAFLGMLFERYFIELLRGAQKSAQEKTVLESELFQSQKMESIALLAGGIAHDFNHGLTSIKSCANLILKKTGEESNEIRKYAHNIYDTCMVISGSTSRLLSFARKSKGEPEALNIHDVVESMLILLAYQLAKNITVTTSLTASPSVVIGDFSQLQSVVMNLALNAGDAMPHGGVLTISTERAAAADIYRSMQHGSGSNDFLVLTVTDTGVGMDDSVRKQLFTPFFTTRQKGTGLGLSVVDRIVKNHGGFIDVSSEPHKGSTFAVYLPAAPRPQL